MKPKRLSDRSSTLSALKRSSMISWTQFNRSGECLSSLFKHSAYVLIFVPGHSKKPCAMKTPSTTLQHSTPRAVPAPNGSQDPRKDRHVVAEGQVKLFQLAGSVLCAVNTAIIVPSALPLHVRPASIFTQCIFVLHLASSYCN